MSSAVGQQGHKQKCTARKAAPGEDERRSMVKECYGDMKEVDRHAPEVRRTSQIDRKKQT